MRSKELQNAEAEVPKKRYISSEERQYIIGELRLVYQYNNGISKNRNILDSASNQPFKFRTKNWIEIMMNQEEQTLLIDKLILKHQC